MSVTFTASKFGSYSRDKDKISDLKAIKIEFPLIQDLDIEHSMWDDWALFGYASRYANFSFWVEESPSKKYLLTPKGYDFSEQLADYKIVSLKLNHYNLLERVN